jgi:hypothetical protein
MGCSNLGGGGCWPLAEGHEGEDGESGGLVGDARRSAAVIGRVKTSGEHAALGLAAHLWRWLSRDRPTAEFGVFLSGGHGALGERLSSTASRGTRVARH